MLQLSYQFQIQLGTVGTEGKVTSNCDKKKSILDRFISAFLNTWSQCIGTKQAQLMGHAQKGLPVKVRAMKSWLSAILYGQDL